MGYDRHDGEKDGYKDMMQIGNTGMNVSVRQTIFTFVAFSIVCFGILVFGADCGGVVEGSDCLGKDIHVVSEAV